MFVFSNKLLNDNGDLLGVFSSHWAAVAAMIRFTQPEFKSLNGDKEKDLKIEKEMKCLKTF